MQEIVWLVKQIEGVGKSLKIVSPKTLLNNELFLLKEALNGNRTSQKIGTHIIHSCAVASATAAAAWSAVPIVGPFSIAVGAATPVLASLTAGMVVALGKLFGKTYTTGAVMGVVGNLLGLVFGVNIARGILSIIPGAGSVANAATTATLQEAVGWAFFYIFDDGKDPTQMTAQEIYKYQQSAVVWSRSPESIHHHLGCVAVY